MACTRRAFIKSILAAWGVLMLPGCTHGDDAAKTAGGPASGAGPGADSGSGATPPAAGGNGWRPRYALLEEEGKLKERVEEAYALMEECVLCPRMCKVNRLKGERGFCRSPEKVIVYSHQPHFGEEVPLVGGRGSGTIFFSNCNLRCVFCQNWPIAHEGRGPQISDERLADMMLNLQRIGCHNINVVTPTHIMPHILNAVRIALHRGLELPVCYNTGGYERPEIIRLLDGIVDIYLPDMKFMDPHMAEKYAAQSLDYPQHAQESVKEMHRQVGELVTNQAGIALEGLMIRHLVMPNRVAGTQDFVHWVADNLTASTYVNIMSQYRVEHRAFEYEHISRAITPQEYLEAMDWAEEAGLTNLDSRSILQRDVFRRRVS